MRSSILQLTCFEFHKKLPGGVTIPLLVKAKDSQEMRYTVVMKLRQPDHRGHGPTCLACELICSVLARKIGLPVPDFAITELPKGFSRICPGDLKELFLRNEGKNFGTVYREGFREFFPARTDNDDTLENVLEDVLTFDATVINGDRQKIKPNLLSMSNDILMIDHSLALPSHLWSEEQLSTSPLFPENNVTEHCTFPTLSGRRKAFNKLLERWRATITTSILDELRNIIPLEWETRSGDLDRIFHFLNDRPRRFSDISTELKRIVK